MTGERTTTDRAMGALTAVTPYLAQTDGDTRTAVVDLIADLCHLLDLAGIDADDVIESARMHHEAEAGGDE